VFGLLAAIALSPVFACVSVVRQHRRHRSWRRTGLLATSWLLGFGGLALADLTLNPWPLLVPALLVVAWQISTRLPRHRRSLYRPPTDAPPFTDADRVPWLPTPADRLHDEHLRDKRR
ncbi:MAG: MerC domain-containing protein, partial [Acidimicrobiales bacterium]